MQRNKNKSALAQCGCYLFILVANLLFGGASVNYLLSEFVGKTIPLFWAVVVGIFVGQFSIPVAVVVWILKLTGIM